MRLIILILILIFIDTELVSAITIFVLILMVCTCTRQKMQLVLDHIFIFILIFVLIFILTRGAAGFFMHNIQLSSFLSCCCRFFSLSLSISSFYLGAAAFCLHLYHYLYTYLTAAVGGWRCNLLNSSSVPAIAPCLFLNRGDYQ